MRVITQLKIDEGFRSRPYQDTEGVWTFGYGFTYLEIDEAEVILRMRVKKIYDKLKPKISNLSPARQDVIVNMAFNLGFKGLSDFVRMWAAVDKEDYDTAANEMLNSKWAKQVKGRAIRLAEIMRKG
jgi:lysozyme